MYIHNKTRTLSEYIKIDSNVYKRKVEGLTLKEYREVREFLCKNYHQEKNCDCMSMIEAANIVLDKGIVPLSKVFKSVFSNVSYHSVSAKR